jgi:hypothetical protein
MILSKDKASGMPYGQLDDELMDSTLPLFSVLIEEREEST